MKELLLDDIKNSESSSATVELDQTRVGRLSRMDAMQSQAMAQALSERQKRKLFEIDRALNKIENQCFGICQNCEQEIDPRRLVADPLVTLCIDCAE